MIEDSFHWIIRCFINLILSASCWFNEKCFWLLSCAFKKNYPTMIPSLTKFIFLFNIWLVIINSVFFSLIFMMIFFLSPFQLFIKLTLMRRFLLNCKVFYRLYVWLLFLAHLLFIFIHVWIIIFFVIWHV